MNKAFLVYKHEEEETRIYYLGNEKDRALTEFGKAIYAECKQEGWPDNICQNTAEKGVETAKNSLGCTYQGISYMES